MGKASGGPVPQLSCCSLLALSAPNTSDQIKQTTGQRAIADNGWSAKNPVVHRSVDHLDRCRSYGFGNTCPLLHRTRSFPSLSCAAYHSMLPFAKLTQ